MVNAEKRSELIEKHLLSIVKEEYISKENFYEKNIILLSTGAILVSLTFLDRIASNTTLYAFFLLILSWLFFILSVCAVVFSSYYGRKYLLAVYTNILGHLGDPQSNLDDTEKQDSFRKKSSTGKTLAGIFLVAGLLALVIFCAINIAHKYSI